MRKLLFLLLASFGFNSFGQTYWNGSTSVETTTTGNAAIQGGQIDLTIPGTWTPGTEPWRSVNSGATYSGLWLNTGTTTANGTYIRMATPKESSNPGAIDFVANSPAATGTGFRFFHHDFSTPGLNNLMALDNWGKLTVNGGLIYLTTSALGSDQWRSINCGSLSKGLYLCTGNSTADGTYIQMHAPGETNAGAMELVTNSPGATGMGFRFIHHDFGSSLPDNNLMALDNWGKLSVNGGLINLSSTALGSDQWRSINCGSLSKGLYLCTGNSTTDGTYIQMHAPGETNAGAMELVTNSPGATGMGFRFMHHDFGSLLPDNNLMSLDNWGKLTVNGGVINLLTLPGTDHFRSINCGSPAGGLYLCTGNTTTDGTYIQMHSPSEASNPGGIEMVSNSVLGLGMGITFSHYNGTATKNDMRIYNSGKVAIGESLISTGSVPDGYLLYVEKGILTEHVKVAAKGSTSWADFVFNKDYELMPLSEVEAYVNKHKHLPAIPSAAEVEENGIDLGETDAKLLQKIEELTLYVIEQQKRIEKLEKQVKNTK